MDWRSARGGSKRELNRDRQGYNRFEDLGENLSSEERDALRALSRNSRQARNSTKLALRLLSLGLAELSCGRLALTPAGRSVLASVPASRTPPQVGFPGRGATAERTPAVPVEGSVTDQAIVCLDCGGRYRALKLHLAAAHGITPDEYRARWALPDGYPMVAPLYSKRRRYLANQMGLGHSARRKTLKRE